ncbi:MAG TPA: non-canonical purine NTP pyrophosphatase, partial [Ilumatobacteraceae bacterium]|nr:non-canonical purine NTP pyrophosphatase [Ilumatobacteraceae bacterium]
TARFAGNGATDADNRAKMLADLVGIEPPRRTARFRTVAMAMWPDGSELAVEGVCEGSLATAERGARGFGYDPLFIPAAQTAVPPQTFAEMSDEAKNAISHRGQALRALVTALTGDAASEESRE